MTWKNQKPPSGIPAGGAGYGGRAKGASTSRFTPENQPTPEQKAQGVVEAKALRELLAPHKAAIVETWVSVLTDPLAPHAAKIAAANAIADRLEGKPAQAIGGSEQLGPVKHVVTWEDGE